MLKTNGFKNNATPLPPHELYHDENLGRETQYNLRPHPLSVPRVTHALC